MNGLNPADLTAEQKVGQMLLCRGPHDQKDFEFLMRLIKNRSLGGIHASSRFAKPDNPNLKTERILIDKILEAADYPILIGEDLEQGFPGVSLMSALELPDQLALGSSDSEELCYEYGRIGAIQAKAKGYNTVFGPVLDIAMNPESACVGLRAFGGNKELVARMAAAAIRGYQDQGMVVSAKHYPGFGESAVDNHLGMVYLEGDEKQLLERELYPYIHAMRHADLSGVMVGHIMAPKVDPQYPASISPKLISLLRDAGYDGLLMTDSFAMIGMTNLFGLETCHRLAMKAGNDMVMADYRTSIEKAYGFMLKAYQDGLVTDAQLDAAARRVIIAQNRTMKKPSQKDVTRREIELTEEMARKAISVTLRGTDKASIDRNAKHLFIFQEGVYYKDPATGNIEQEPCVLSTAKTVLEEMFPNADFIAIPEFPVRQQIEHTMAATLKYDSVIVVLLNRCAPYTGSSDSTQRMVAVMNGLDKKLSAVLLFGNPYSARDFGPVKRIIYGYQGNYCQKYAALTLAGEHTATGKLPVDFRF